MNGRIGVFELVFILAMFMTPLYMVVFQAINSDHTELKIEKSYLNEYEQCKIDLKNTQPICPACECKTEDGFMRYIIGFIFGIICTVLIFTYKEGIKEKLSKNFANQKETAEVEV